MHGGTVAEVSVSSVADGQCGRGGRLFRGRSREPSNCRWARNKSEAEAGHWTLTRSYSAQPPRPPVRSCWRWPGLVASRRHFPCCPLPSALCPPPSALALPTRSIAPTRPASHVSPICSALPSALDPLAVRMAGWVQHHVVYSVICLYTHTNTDACPSSSPSTCLETRGWPGK